MKQTKKTESALLRRLVLAVLGVILGVNAYLANARGLAGNQMPMPFGFGAAVVMSGSMEPALMVDDVIIVREADSYEVGDMVVYQNGHTLIVHRIIAKDGETVVTQGDANNGEPYHAGTYTASITKKNGETPVTASVEYTIAKADQEAPEKPTYGISDDKKKAKINRLAKDPHNFTDDANRSHMAKAEYSLTYHGATNIEWKTFADSTTGQLEITMQNALTNYTVQARYQELEDYNVSKITKAAEVYFFAGNVTVIINCDEGIKCEKVEATGSNDHTDGVTLTLKTDDKYYLVFGEYMVTTELKMNNGTTPSDPAVTNTDNEYAVTNIPDNSTLTINIGTAKKKPLPTAQVTPGQKFSTFNDTATTISRDSAFTAAFQISNFDPDTYDTPSLIFDSAIPEDATMILLNREKNGAKTYWYYRAPNGTTTSVPLTSFTEMGGGGTYAIPSADTNGYVDLSYQFIVDVSQSGGYADDVTSLEMTLGTEVKTSQAGTKAPSASALATVNMADSSFTLAENGGSDLTKEFTYTFDKGAAASKWENRASALVLTPKGGTSLPPDAQIKTEVNGGTTYLYKNNSSFIVPLSLLEAGDKKVTLTLQSALFPKAETSYSFTAEWLISPSKAGKSPMTGDPAGILNNVTFTSAAKKAPSLKTKGDRRVLTNNEKLELTIETQNMDGYTVSAALLRKSDSGTDYLGTGWNKQDVTAGRLDVLLGGQEPGSFCLMLTVKPKDSVTVVMEVPYYFVIKSTQ